MKNIEKQVIQLALKLCNFIYLTLSWKLDAANIDSGGISKFIKAVGQIDLRS